MINQFNSIKVRNTVEAALIAACFAFALLWATPDAAHASDTPGLAPTTVPYQLQNVAVSEQLGRQVDPDLPFTDHNGKDVRIGDYLTDDKPVLLTLNYYSCATLCSLQLNALLEGLKELEWNAGEEFRIVTVSIDHREDAKLAAQKRKTYLAELGRGELDWSFLVGTEENIATLAETIGFSFQYDAVSDQYAHPALLTFLAESGIVTRYIYGIQYPARDLKFALIETAEGRVGSPVDKLILSCFRYDSTAGRYTATIFGIARLGGVLTILTLAGFGLVMWRFERTVRRDGSPDR
jgi:protein SCO1/2